MSPRYFDKEDTQVFKGVGILLILFHNYFHWVRPTSGENEFSFSRNRARELYSGLASQPLETINLLSDYFGHYGVQIFVFLSAYGLTRAYGDRSIGWTPFMWSRFKRIYPMFALAVLAHAIFVVTLWNEHLLWFLKVYALYLSFVVNFWPGLQLSLVGPWWYFSLTFQFYAIFLLLNRLAVRYGAAGLVVVGTVGIVVTALGNSYLMPHDLNLFFTVVGHLPVLCLGIHMGRTGDLSRSYGLPLLAVALLFIGAAWFRPLWYLAPICVVVLFNAGFTKGVGRLRAWQPGYKFVKYCGDLSLPLFAIHGMLRQPFVEVANAYGVWYITLGLAACFLIASLIAAQLMQLIEGLFRSWIARFRAVQG